MHSSCSWESVRSKTIPLLREVKTNERSKERCITEKQTMQSPDNFSERYNGYVERYEKAKAQYDEITDILDARAVKGRAIDRFLRDISGREELLAEFDEVLWLTVIDIVTVRKDGVLVFRFHDGREIEG